MSALTEASLAAAWEAEGRRLAATFDTVASAVVLAPDPAAAAHVALGIARVQSERRHVAIGDLVGDLPALRSLLVDDDPHGITDSFLYGVSLNRIAHPVDAAGKLHILPSGSEPTLDEEILRSPRWGRLATGFREMNALLLLVAPVDVPGLDALAASSDGVVVVDDAHVPGAVPVLARAAIERISRAPVRRSTGEMGSTVPAPRQAPVNQPSASGARRWRRRALVAAALVVGAALGWQLFGRTVVATRSVTADSAAGSTVVTPAVTGDSESAAVDLPPIVGSATDSSRAAAYGIEIIATNTQLDAMAKIDDLRRYPSVTFSPVALRNSGRPWYRVIVGALPTAAAADSLRAALRRDRVLTSEGIVRRAPLALLVERSVTRETAPAMVAGWIERDIPAYALLQDDGTATIYAGAFESAEQSIVLAQKLRAVGVTPSLVYRIGSLP